MHSLHLGPLRPDSGGRKRRRFPPRAIVSDCSVAMGHAAPASRAVIARLAKAQSSVRPARYFLRKLTLHACTRWNADRTDSERTRPDRILDAFAAFGSRAELTIAAPDRGAPTNSTGAIENETTEQDPTAIIRRARGTPRHARSHAGWMRSDDALGNDDPRRPPGGAGAVVAARLHAVRQLKRLTRVPSAARARPSRSAAPCRCTSGRFPAPPTLQDGNHHAIFS